MRVFTEAKARFALHLRPADVLSGLADAQHLYQLTAAGEAAERALDFFFEQLKRPGELQTTALDDIRSLLGELGHLAAGDELDEAKVHRTLKELTSRFDELTSRAHTFIGSLLRTVDLHGLQFDSFLAYKELLIEYLERFIGELTVATVDIGGRLLAVEEHGVDRLLAIAAQRDLADAFNPTEEDQHSALQAWRSRWSGLRGWFIGRSGLSSQAEVLRARARSAIPALLNAVVNIHDRRTSRSDRPADLRTLARWFAETDNDQEAHQLWRAAFALAPARHLRIDDDSLDDRAERPVPSSTSWLDAPPISIAPRLRKSGRHASRGPAKAIIDRTEEKAVLAEAMAAEAEQLRRARERLTDRGIARLSEIGHLNSLEFSLFLDILGEALSKKIAPSDRVETNSSDGTLVICLWPTEDGGSATIETDWGCFSGEDHFISITEQFGDKSAAFSRLGPELPETEGEVARRAPAGRNLRPVEVV
ncbi:MAG: TIGR02677 family protein [Planctomycetes bacterium]|nr:TIGR02677 family protein [Planctomycetota bacterium]